MRLTARVVNGCEFEADPRVQIDGDAALDVRIDADCRSGLRAVVRIDERAHGATPQANGVVTSEHSDDGPTIVTVLF